MLWAKMALRCTMFVRKTRSLVLHSGIKSMSASAPLLEICR